MTALKRIFWVFGVWMIGASHVSSQTLTPAHTLRPGHVLTAVDVVVAEGRRGAFSDIDQVLGLEVRRTLYRGKPLQIGDIGAPALVERNEIVTLIYQTGTLSIATEGRALGRGGIGDKLRVLNLVSKNTVVGRVSDTGEITVSRE